MDCRITLAINETFIDLLSQAYAMGEKVAMIIDDNGLERMEGFIATFNRTDPSPFIVLDNGCKVHLDKIAAVNGVFLAPYTGC